jgi:hypothetical protein
MSDEEYYEEQEQERVRFGRDYYGKHEKEHEKEYEKEEEKARGAWGFEKWRSDPVSAVVWAAVLIWAGVALLLGNLGFLDRFEMLEGGDLALIGAGVILLLAVVFRVLVPSYRRPVLGTFFLALVFLGFGLGNWLGAGVTWAVILIVFGVFVLVRGVFGRR